jgi:hypothetical protein
LRSFAPSLYDALTRVASLATSNGVPLPPMLKYALEYQTDGGGADAKGDAPAHSESSVGAVEFVQAGVIWMTSLDLR